MRLFLALMIPEELIARVADVQKELRKVILTDGVRWTRPEQFHYTVKFLGETSTGQAQKATDCTAAFCEHAAPFEIHLAGIGAFPNSSRPSVLWLGAAEGADALTQLAAGLDEALHREGFPKERKPAKAHLTLARIKSYAGEMAAARALRTAEVGAIGSFTADGIVLMQSTLKPGGSEYAVVERFRFGGQA